MGILDRLFGREPQPANERTTAAVTPGSADEQAVARYRYLLRTAAPETIEQTHAEAFAKLTPEQRHMVLNELGGELPEAERSAVLAGGDDPRALARIATRAELRRPGTMERTFGRVGSTPGIGAMMAGTFLSTMAGAVLGTAMAQSFFGHDALGAGSSPFTEASYTGAGEGGDSFTDAGDVGGGFDGDIGGFDV